MSKKKAEKDVALAEKQGKLKTVKDKDKNSALKSSTAFFNVLQDQAKSHVKEISGKKAKKKKSNVVSLSALKL